MSQKELNLNIKESSIRKKRGISFFADKKKVDVILESEGGYWASETKNDIMKMMNYSIANRNDIGLEPGTSTKTNSAA